MYNLYKKDDVTINRIVKEIIIDCITKSGLTDNKTTRITILHYSHIHVHVHVHSCNILIIMMINANRRRCLHKHISLICYKMSIHICAHLVN